PDKNAVPQHWNAENSAKTASCHSSDDERIALDVGAGLRDVSDLYRLFALSRAAKGAVRTRMYDGGACFSECRRRVVHRDRAEAIILAQIECAELGLADAHRVLQDAFEHRPQLT